MRHRLALVVAAWMAAFAMRADAQESDSARTLNTVVVTAERTPAALATASAAVTRIDARQLATLPHATVADVLRLAPGFALVDADGLGFEPRLIARGFYGGGETDYALMLVDGHPVNQLQSGVIAWEALPPLESIEAIEIVRGSSSALYGDAAVGAVINIITNAPGRAETRWSLSRGSFDSWRATAGVAGDYLWRDATLSAEAHGTNGYRDHAQRTSGRLDGGLLLRATDTDSVTVDARAHWREVDDPGPLLDSLLAEDRSASDPFFRFDGARDRGVALRVRGLDLDDGMRTSASLGVERRLSESIRTVALSPDFADTKGRDVTSTIVSTGAQIHAAHTRLPGLDEVLVGVEGSRGWMASTHYEVTSGTRAEYAALDGVPGSAVPTSPPGRTVAAGDGTRSAAAVFAQYAVALRPAFRVSLGGRYDWLRDSFLPTWPNAEPRVKASHAAFSPKVGLNVRYLDGVRAAGHVYATASRSFRAPTLDQLFDQRTFPVPFPPYEISSSNALLEPQYGVNLEAGAYQSASIGARATLAATLSAYQMDMKDELDFDVATLRYVNIGRSRHRGIEIGLGLSGIRSASVWMNHTLQSVTARSGAHSGRRLKAIPRHATSAGLAITLLRSLHVRGIVSHTRDAFIDDANTVDLPAYTRVDASAAYRLRGIEIVGEVRNLFGERYSTTAFPDPSGSDAVFFHPAAGRVVQLGIRSAR